MKLLEDLRWRYATKRFDADRTVSESDLQTLKTATNLAATSFGLQPFRIKIVSDAATKEKLRAASYDQPQLTEASHIFIFCHKLDVAPEYVDAFMKRMAEVREMPTERIEGYGDYIKGSLEGKEAEFLQDWNRRQAYIALGNLMVAAASLRLDSCPMEGFDPEKYSDILGLKEKGLGAAVICPVGYRSAEDQTQFAKKVRWSEDEMFF